MALLRRWKDDLNPRVWEPGCQRWLDFEEMGLKGYGVLLCPIWDVEDELAAGDLVTALDEFLPDNANLYAVYDGSMVNHRVRALIDFLAEEFHR